jgi:hypothetical protein
VSPDTSPGSGALADLRAAETILRSGRRSEFDLLFAGELEDVISRYAGDHPDEARAGPPGQPLPAPRLRERLIRLSGWSVGAADGLPPTAVEDVVSHLENACAAIYKEREPHKHPFRSEFHYKLLALEIDDILRRFVGRCIAP